MKPEPAVSLALIRLQQELAIDLNDGVRLTKPHILETIRRVIRQENKKH
jgi:hypothetical protein